MTIQFNQIPANLRVPFFYAEVTAGQSPFQSIARLLLIGQKTAAGTATNEEPILVTQGEDALFGPGSQLAGMYKIARRVAPFQEIWCAPLTDDVGAAKAVGALDIEGAPVLNPGTIVLYVGDIRVTVSVNGVMSNNAIQAALVNDINSCPGMQVTASAGVAGVKATGGVVVTGPATSAGAATLNVGARSYTVSVANGSTDAQIAAALVTAINQSPNKNVIATVAGANIGLTALDTGVAPNAFAITASTTSAGVTLTPAGATLTGGTKTTVTLTANNAGTLGNGIGVFTQLFPDDGPFADNLLTITPLANGAGDPSISGVLANMSDSEFDWIVMPYSDSAVLAEMDVFLDDRWGPMQQLYGHYVTARNGTTGALQAHVNPRNGWHGSLVGLNNYPAPTYLVAAAVGAQMAQHLQSPPELSRPLQTLELKGLRGPKALADRFSIVERQSFYYSGVSALTVQRDGTVVIDRITSMYKKDVWGSNDMTWLDVNTQAQVMYAVRFFKQKITSTYPRAALVDDNPNNLQGFATADDIRNVMVHAYRELTLLGVLENPDLFEELLVVERNATDPNRVDCYLPLDHVNQLRILAANVTSYLQYPAAV